MVTKRVAFSYNLTHHIAKMAFSQAPSVSTYQKSRVIPLMESLDNRTTSTSKDKDYLNCVFEIVQNIESRGIDVWVAKRPGITQYGSSLSAPVRGLYYWESADKLFVANDNDIRVITASTGVTVTNLSNVFSTTSGTVGFTEFLYEDTSVKIVATDGTTMITIDSANTVVTVADADMPVHLPYPVFLDGYIFVLKAGSGDIYNSNLNNPTAWTAGDFITAEIDPDYARVITKINNYIVVLGQNSIEFFYDAGIATGSPLQRNDSPVKFNGYIGGFAQEGNIVYFVGNTNKGSPTVYELKEFTLTDIGSPSVKKRLQNAALVTGTTRGVVVSAQGRSMYVMTITGDVTYVYDPMVKQWTRWGYRTTESMDILHAVIIRTSDSWVTVLGRSGENMIDSMDPENVQDNSSPFTVRIVTDNIHFDTWNQKFMSRLIVHCDKPNGSATLSVSYSDDDYQTYSTARSLELYQDLPSLTGLGRFRRRAFKLEYAGTRAIRFKQLEVNYNIGAH